MQNITVMALMSAQYLIIIPALTIGVNLAWLIPNARAGRRIAGMVLLSVACLLLAWMFATLASAPAFNFIDRCRPPGTGMCIDHRTFETVRMEIWRDYFLAALLYIVLPIGIGVGGLILAFQRVVRKYAVK